MKNLIPFNINHEMLIEINDKTIELLKKNYQIDFIYSHILGKKEVVNGKQYYRMQMHQAFSYFGKELEAMNTNVFLIPDNTSELIAKASKPARAELKLMELIPIKKELIADLSVKQNPIQITITIGDSPDIDFDQLEYDYVHEIKDVIIDKLKADVKEDYNELKYLISKNEL